MEATIKIPYQETGYFSNMMLDYIQQKEALSPFYHRFPSIENFEGQIQEKASFFTPHHRKTLVHALEKQYQHTKTSTLVKENINQLLLPNTFTITTGHQLNLFSGPLYFLYKIVSVINLCKTLQKNYPKQHFIPVFWLATEDHDFEEINHFYCKGDKLSWNLPVSGPVGRIKTHDFEKIYHEFDQLLNQSKHAHQLRNWFKTAYTQHNNLTNATRYLVNELFKQEGLVVIDGDDVDLKSLFNPYAIKEINEQVTFTQVSQTNDLLKKAGYHAQVHVQPINLFYLNNNLRERLVATNKGITINHTQLIFKDTSTLHQHLTESEGVNQLSGNALLRPLYQEIVLPNLCYVGGGGEIAYWMQLKSTFEAFKVPFPILLMRNSALVINQKQVQKLHKLKVTIQDLFLSQEQLIQLKINQLSTLQLQLTPYKNQIQRVFNELKNLIQQTDKSFEGAVLAQEKKQLKGILQLEKRLYKAEKKKYYQELTRLEVLQNELFPNHSLEERRKNFADYYENYGNDFLRILFQHLNPLDFSFTVIIAEAAIQKIQVTN